MKHLSRLFTTVFVLSLLTACAGQPAASTTPTGSTLVATAETTASTAPDAPIAPTEAAELPALRIVTSFQIDSLNPSEDGFWMPEFGVAEMLTQFRQDGKYYPWLLESFSNSDDLTWKLTLRPGLTFQNGKPVDAQAVVACIQRQMQYSSSAQGSIPEGTTFEVSGEREITVTTTSPFPSLPGVLANESIFMIYDAAAVDAVGERWEELAGAGIYTGPYSIVSLNDQELALTRYEPYWQGRPALPGVTVRFVTDPQARILAVQNDEADIALYPPSAAKSVIDAQEGLHFNYGTPGTGGFMMVLNLQKPPFDELAVRQAIIKAIDYEEIANDVFDGVFTPATSWYAPIFPWAINNQKTDRVEATRLLDAAGWAIGTDGIRAKNGQRLALLLVIYPQQPDLEPMSNAVQSQLKELGIEVAIQSVDDINATLRENSVAWNAGLIGNSTTSWGIPEPILRRYYITGGDRNYGKFSNAEIDTLTEELSKTIDEEQRSTILKRIQEIMVEEEPYAFNLNISNSRVIVNDRYRGYQPGFSLYHISYQTQPSQ